MSRDRLLRAVGTDLEGLSIPSPWCRNPEEEAMKKVDDKDLKKVTGGSTWNDPGEIGSQESIGQDPGQNENPPGSGT